ncbi:uncharacterized protein LOC130676714 isoform X1 [Microplitis mediator]|uniref:uncharacterized protein LOC130676714 isoform X1 n=1 Tax=Microplitis mediator TaxID=375433 RepID=UPI0025521486|nr:uncharacterized protein LOC130676714 isoform X1 [Microplitis mediator]
MMTTMYDEFYEQSAWCYWVVSVATLLSFVGFIVACICSCRHGENKSEFLGLPGMVTITHADNDDYDGQPTFSDITPVVTQDIVDGGKRCQAHDLAWQHDPLTSGANRSLPDIPKDRNVGNDENGIGSTPQDVIYEATEIMNDSSELYATVRDKNPKRDNERGTRTSSQESSSLQEDDSVSPYARLNTLNSTTDEHPYAQVQSVQKSEVNRQNSFRNPSQMTDNVACTSTSQPTNPVAPPRTRRSSSHNSLLNTEVTTCDIQAANAITGGVQANQDLPYMTPPLLMPLPRPPQPQHNGPPQHFSGDSQDSNKGYTSISVREPLANIIAQTKAAHQNRQTSHRPVQDSHYATVSDDSDEMYAAIDEQEKIYTSGSETYAQIQPMICEQSRVVVHGEPQLLHQPAPRIIPEESAVFSAPQPPSVDSLRHVAHAHSRQASSSSATSSIANPGSPKPEKRQANSPLPPPPPPLPSGSTEGNTDVYACVDKQHKKPEDHQPPTSHSSLLPGKSVEDMYAKVLKKKRDSEEEYLGSNAPVNDAQIPGKKLNLVEISRASWSSHDSVEINKREPEIRVSVPPDILNLESAIEFSAVARKYELDRVTPDHVFEPMNTQRTINSVSEPNDPNYEMLRPPYSRTEDSKLLSSQPSTSMRNGIDVLSFYSVPFKHRQVSNASSEDPGYEKVRLRRRIDIDGDTDSEPNYESMPHDHSEPNYASVCRPGDSDTDPNYESVHNSDPNYESVRYMSVTNKKNSDPPYEQVNSYLETRLNVDGYEKVKSKEIDDPNYEKINNTRERERERDNFKNTDTDDEQYVQV